MNNNEEIMPVHTNMKLLNFPSNKFSEKKGAISTGMQNTVFDKIDQKYIISLKTINSTISI